MLPTDHAELDGDDPLSSGILLANDDGKRRQIGGEGNRRDGAQCRSSGLERLRDGIGEAFERRRIEVCRARNEAGAFHLASLILLAGPVSVEATPTSMRETIAQGKIKRFLTAMEAMDAEAQKREH
jgi:hypothetical protein